MVCSPGYGSRASNFYKYRVIASDVVNGPTTMTAMSTHPSEAGPKAQFFGWEHKDGLTTANFCFDDGSVESFRFIHWERTVLQLDFDVMPFLSNQTHGAGGILPYGQ